MSSTSTTSLEAARTVPSSAPSLGPSAPAVGSRPIEGSLAGRGAPLGRLPGASDDSFEGASARGKVASPPTGSPVRTVGAHSAVLGARLEQQREPTVFGAELTDGALTVETAAGRIDLGPLDGGSSIGHFWVSPDSRKVVFAKGTGGGYENENQSLFVLDGKTGGLAAILSEREYVAVFEDVTFASLPDGRRIALATEADGGLGAGSVYVIDLERARVIGREIGALKDLVRTPEGLVLKLEIINDGGEPMPPVKVPLAGILDRGVPSIRAAEKTPGGELVVAVGAEKISLGQLDGGSSIGHFWVSPDRRSVVYSVGTGGGYENENQTLFEFDAETKKSRQLLGPAQNVAMFDDVRFAAAPNGHVCVVASESDGGLGAGTTFVVDLTNGDVLGSVPGFMEDGPSAPAFSQRGFETKVHTRIISEEGERHAVFDLTPILATARTTIDM